MAFNPSPEVAAARDAAKKFGKPMAVLVLIDTEQLHVASYGADPGLCSVAKVLGDAAFKAIMEAFENEPELAYLIVGGKQ